MELRREAFDKLVAENPTALYALVQELARQVATLTAQQALLTAQVPGSCWVCTMTTLWWRFCQAVEPLRLVIWD